MPVICDFCSGSPTVAVYLADDFIVYAMSSARILQESVGGWAACALCEKLIDAGDWDTVLTHSVATFLSNYPSLPILESEIRAELRILFAQLRRQNFRKKMEG